MNILFLEIHPSKRLHLKSIGLQIHITLLTIDYWWRHDGEDNGEDEDDELMMVSWSSKLEEGAIEDSSYIPDINGAGIEAPNITSIVCEARVLIEAVSVIEAHVVGAVRSEGGMLGGSN